MPAWAHYPSLTGRSVVVTGGGSGIGAQIVRRFCEHGSRVAFLDKYFRAGKTAPAIAGARSSGSPSATDQPSRKLLDAPGSATGATLMSRLSGAFSDEAMLEIDDDVAVSLTPVIPRTHPFGQDFHLRSIRPGVGLAPRHLPQVLGRRARMAIARGTPMAWDLLA